MAITAALRSKAASSWQGEGALDVSGVEFMDGRSLAVVPDEAFTRAGVARPAPRDGLLLVQIEIAGGEVEALEQMDALLHACGVHADPHVALPGDERGAARLFELREAVPASLNAMIAAAKLSVHPEIEKTAGDLVVPFERLEESLALYRETFERCGLEYALWGHASTGTCTRTSASLTRGVRRGKAALLEIAYAWCDGGAPLAETASGEAPSSSSAARALRRGWDREMRAVKRALDRNGSSRLVCYSSPVNPGPPSRNSPATPAAATCESRPTSSNCDWTAISDSSACSVLCKSRRPAYPTL